MASSSWTRSRKSKSLILALALRIVQVRPRGPLISHPWAHSQDQRVLLERTKVWLGLSAQILDKKSFGLHPRPVELGGWIIFSCMSTEQLICQEDVLSQVPQERQSGFYFFLSLFPPSSVGMNVGRARTYREGTGQDRAWVPWPFTCQVKTGNKNSIAWLWKFDASSSNLTDNSLVGGLGWNSVTVLCHRHLSLCLPTYLPTWLTGLVGWAGWHLSFFSCMLDMFEQLFSSRDRPASLFLSWNTQS